MISVASGGLLSAERLVSNMVTFRNEQIQEIIAHAQAEAPLEAGGLLAGSGATIERVYPMENTDRSETSFLLNPEEQYRVFVEIEELGYELAGIYHSHPHSDAYPSARDMEMAYYPEAVYVIVSLAGPHPEIRAFRIRDGVASEEEITVRP